MDVKKDELAYSEVIIGDCVYDLKRFAKHHPGGATMLNIFGGNDATVHYHMLHGHKNIRVDALEPFKIRNKSQPFQHQYLLNSAIFQDLKQRVSKAIPNPYATSEWYIKAIVIMVCNLFLELHSIVYGFTYVKSAFLGMTMALIGLCIQHDANHGAVSRKPWVNVLWGYTQDWIGGSSLLWKHHHVLMHHAYTNTINADPDVTTSAIRVHNTIEKRNYHYFQTIYTWFLFMLLPLSWHFKEIYDMVAMKHCGSNISKMARGESNIGIFLRCLFLIRFYVIPLYLYPSLHTILCILVCLSIGGLYLGINFIISHNFEGTLCSLSFDNVSDKKKDWAIEQINTSSTVGGRILGFFHGGLNYQIEHHLFPRISHVHYHIVQRIVMEWCNEHGIKYNYYNNLYENLKSCIYHLNSMGKGFEM